ncbi:membrane dipeptidase [Ruthenibacterium sp. CLA-JM-H11]|uniref:Membrane dipeptidase n=1 Tax=Ruthenibacterium intestinale TaxID=3133163 RepID=A0ABV1GJ37_9FIRM
MDFFDLHCDTVVQLMKSGQDLAASAGHVSFSKAAGLRRWGQVFALFIHDNQAGDAYGCYCRERDFFQSILRKYPEKILQCRTPDDMEDAFASGKCAAILSVENGSALEGRLDRLQELAQDGVKLLTLTWFGENELGYGSAEGGALKPFGRQVVEALPEYGIIPDISHLSDEGVSDVFSLYSGPVLASHSNARKITGHCRNLTDRQIQEISRRGGLIGVNLYTDFLLGPREVDSMDAVYRHVNHFLELGAGQALSFGTDFDGSIPIREVADLSHIPALYHYLLQKGIDEKILQGIFFENARRFWLRTL